MNSRIRTVPTAVLFCMLALPAALFGMAPVEGWNGLTANSTTTEIVVRTLEMNEDYLEVEWTIPGFEVTSVTTPAGEFQRLDISREIHPTRSLIGGPELPSLAEMIRFPSGTVGKVEVLEAEWASFSDVRPTPLQSPIKDGETSPPFEFDAKAYQLDQVFPTDIAGVTTPKGWGGLEVGGLWVAPFRYTPSTKELQVARRMIVRVQFVAAPGFDVVKSRSPSRWMQMAQNSSVLNPPIEPPDINDADEPEPVRLLVVTRQEALETAMPLIEMRRNHGLRAEIWVVDNDIQQIQLKNRIRELFEDGLEYVLYIGDGDTLSPAIPMFFWEDDYPGERLDDNGHDPMWCGSDTWYVCLDGVDRDGYTDHTPDLAIGRLVYDNINELQQLETQVSKLTDYIGWNFEQQNGAWLNRCVLVADDNNLADIDILPGRHYQRCKEEIENFEYRQQHPQFVPLYGRQGARNVDVIREMNAGTGFVNYRGHGDTYIWYSWNGGGQNFDATEVDDLNNRQMPFILFSSACTTGDIYRTGGRNCLMESFQKSPEGGSLCANGAVETTFTLGNTVADIEQFKAMFDEGIHSIGYANNVGLTRSLIFFNTWQVHRWQGIGYFNMRAYLWLGDPSVEFRLSGPARLTVEADSLLPVGAHRAEVLVTVGNLGFLGSTVVARTADDDVYSIATTDFNGIATLEFEDALEEGQELIISASHREAIPSSQMAIVADGRGIIEGRVTALADNRPIEGSEVVLVRFQAISISDQNGNFRFEGIPSGNYQLVASIEGMVPQQRNIVVIEQDTAELEFDLGFSRMNFGVEGVVAELLTDSSSQVQASFRNEGNVELAWSANFQIEQLQEPFEERAELFPGLEVNDEKIFGAVFVDDNFYVAGGNNGGDPNYIYVLDREGVEIRNRRFRQESSGMGFRDLEFDGEFLYGAADADIKVMTLDGDVVDTIPTPYDPCQAIAIDPEGDLWVGKNNVAIHRIDREGNILQTIQNNSVYVLGLSWYPDGADGFVLLIWGRAEALGVTLFEVNPVSGVIHERQVLAEHAAETVVEGLSTTLDYDPLNWSMVGVLRDRNIAEARAQFVLKVLNLGPRTGWITMEQDEGSLEPNGESSLDFSFDAQSIPEGTVLRGEAQITTNNVGESLSLPVELRVSPNAVERNLSDILPVHLALTRIYPNPFNSTLKVEISMPQSGLLRVAIYDIQGRLVSNLSEFNAAAGTHTIALLADRIPNGLYLVKAEAGGKVVTAKAVLLK